LPNLIIRLKLTLILMLVQDKRLLAGGCTELGTRPSNPPSWDRCWYKRERRQVATAAAQTTDDAEEDAGYRQSRLSGEKKCAAVHCITRFFFFF
jgi:hypothetical protein